VASPPDKLGRARFVRALFNGIASRYDVTNEIITLGRIGRWREKLARGIDLRAARTVLDIAAGTGDLALTIARHSPEDTQFIGIDLSPRMLKRAQAKVKARCLERRFTFILADATALPLKDGVVDCAVNAFFLRHLVSLPAAFVEFQRVLRPGGTFASLELTQPTLPLFRQVYGFLFRHWIPLLGGLVSGNRAAFDYLPRSWASFPGHLELLRILRQAGYERTKCLLMGIGVAAVHSGIKPDDEPPQALGRTR
jgi:demethylmenaquinone methyltransferase/2-methoxy-6-polyprenyl-1,4-benzoquinol methylase